MAFGQEEVGTKTDLVKTGLDQQTQQHLKTVELAKPAATAALQGYAKIGRPPAELGFKLPEPKGDLTALKAFAKTPMAITGVFDALRGYVGLDQTGKPTINTEKLDKVRELLKNMVREQREHVLDIITKIYLQKHLETSGLEANKAALAGKKAERDASLGLGLGAANELANKGVGTTFENQKMILDYAKKGLNETQRLNETQLGDMLRAALEMGFSTAAVFSAAKPKESELKIPGTMPVERDRMIQHLVQASILMVNELNKRMKEADKSGDKKEYDAAFAQLAAFYGSQKKAEDFVNTGIEGNESTVVAISAAAEMYAYGRLGNVRPVKLKQAMS